MCGEERKGLVVNILYSHSLTGPYESLACETKS